MKHLLAKWLIGQSVDSGKPLPRWVRQLTETNEDLRTEYESMQVLVSKLRDDSATFFPAEQRPSQLKATRHSQSVRSTTVVIAIVAIVLLAAAVWKLQPEDTPENIVQQPIPVSPNDIKIVETAIASPLKIADRLAARASSIASKTPDFSRPDVAAFTTKPVKAAGRKFGQLLAVFAQPTK